MLETIQLSAVVERCNYAGKADGAEGESSRKRDARVEITFKISLKGEFLEEVEQRYFPGVEELIHLTADKSRHYESSLKLNSFSDQKMVIEDANGKEILSHVVNVKNPVKIRTKEGIGDVFLRVEFIYEGSLNILKTLDDTKVQLTIHAAQEDMFDDVLEAARQNEIAEHHGEVDTGSETQESFGEFGEEEFEEGEGFENGEEGSGLIPPIDPQASLNPINPDQVDWRKAKIASTKGATKALEGLDEFQAHQVRQEAALIAFDSLVEKDNLGNSLSITVADLKEARKQLNY